MEQLLRWTLNTILRNPLLFWAAVIANLLGTVIGGAVWYGPMILSSPIWALPFIPDCPLAALLGTIALAGPGADGLYRARQPNRIIRRYAKVARKQRFLLLLDIQPGRARFIDEVKHLRKWLKRPYVSVALDPEWNMGRHGVPGERIGSVHAGMINRVTLYLNRLIRRHRLPDKLVVVHQFTDSMIRDKHKLKRRRYVDLVLNADGFGTPGQKRAKYKELAPPKNSWMRPGFKLFYKEDTNLMSPREVMRLRPRPAFVVYE